jgi:hypothetical protein
MIVTLPASLTDPSPTPAPVKPLRPGPRPIPQHGEFPLAAVGTGTERSLLTSKAGARFWMGSTSAISDAMAGAQLLAAKQNQVFGVFNPRPGHAGALMVVPVFARDASGGFTPLASVAQLGPISARNPRLVGLADAGGVHLLADVPVDPTLRAPRG